MARCHGPLFVAATDTQFVEPPPPPPPPPSLPVYLVHLVRFVQPSQVAGGASLDKVSIHPYSPETPGGLYQYEYAFLVHLVRVV
jgi:hypothetical protein